MHSNLRGNLKELAEKAPFTAFSLGVFTILSVFGGRNYRHPESNNETRKERTLLVGTRCLTDSNFNRFFIHQIFPRPAKSAWYTL